MWIIIFLKKVTNWRNIKQQSNKTAFVKYPKTASNLLNLIQSNIITQELETADKPNIDIESVTTEYPKTGTRSSKSIKKPKTII